jgi:uncharacterized protein YjiK
MSRTSRTLTLAALSILSCALLTAPASAVWPTGSTGTNLGGGLGSCPWLNSSSGTGTPPAFEPSGIVWDDFTGALWLVGDEGQIARMQDDGSAPSCWTLQAGLDLESVTVTGNSLKVYLGVEYPPQILEYNSSSTVAPSATGKSWSLPFPTGTVNASDGMEGMTWVPNGEHPYVSSGSGGVFFASSQKNGTIYVFDVNLSSSGSTPVLRGSFTPDSAQTDISDLYYSPKTHLLYVLYDTANVLRAIDVSTTSFTIKATYSLPTTTTDQEGVTVLPTCPASTTNIYLADDQGSTAHNVFSFNNFPQTCVP